MQSLYALGIKRGNDLSLSENPLGCSPLVAEKLTKNAFAFNSYPIPNGSTLKSSISSKTGCPPENIFISNGSEAIINAIPQILASPGDEAIIPSLTFPMFSICSEFAGLNVQCAPMTKKLEIDLQAIQDLVTTKTKLIFICNPNNPTGSVISKNKLVQFFKTVPTSVVIVIDEANIEFGGESVSNLTSRFSNLMVLRTFSKGFGLANLRIGYAIANQSIITTLREQTPVFPISGLSEALCSVALQDDDFILQTKQFIDEQRKLLTDELKKLGFTVFPSEANNLFVKLPNDLKSDAFLSMLEKADISVVTGSSFAGFDDSFFRVSPRSAKTNAIFLAAVTQLYHSAMD